MLALLLRALYKTIIIIAYYSYYLHFYAVYLLKSHLPLIYPVSIDKSMQRKIFDILKKKLFLRKSKISRCISISRNKVYAIFKNGNLSWMVVCEVTSALDVLKNRKNYTVQN